MAVTLEKRRLRAVLSMCTNGWQGSAKKLEPSSWQWWGLARGNGQELKHSFLWTPGDISPCWQLSIGEGFPDRLQHLHPWRSSKAIWVWSWTTDQGGPRRCLISEATPNGLQDFFLPQTFCASVSLTGKRKSLGEVKDARDYSLKIESKVLASVRSQRKDC